MPDYPVTPDGRYFVVKGKLWRCSNPSLSEADRAHWVKALMSARSAVRSAGLSQDKAAMAHARSNVHQAKVALGERGAPWWDDGAPDLNRRRVSNTVYAQWFEALGQLAQST